MTRHQRLTHPQPVDECYLCRISSVQVGPAAIPSRQRDPRQYAFQESFAAEFVNGDREAYKRLREQGLQPPRIAGSANLERHAETRYEVETGQIAADGKALRQALKIADEGGFDPLVPATTPKEA